MSSASDQRTRRGVAALAVAVLLGLGGAMSAARATGVPAAPATPLRVCADPNNLPFSNARGEGFENAIARLLAKDLHRPLAYTWWPQRRGFVRNTLKAHRCDVVIGVPARYEMVQTTQPYYRSSYVFVTRRRAHLDIENLDDPRLKRLQIGVHAVGDDYANVPPALALARRGVIDNIHGYSIYGDYSRPDPTRSLIDAVADGQIDVAVAWGPFAGYFAQQEKQPLEIHPVQGEHDPALAMSYAIAMGVRKDDDALRRTLDGFIVRRRGDIDRVLDRYGVPRLPAQASNDGRQ